MDRKTIEKFLRNSCTPEEAERVRRWLLSSEGQKYVDEILDEDIHFIRSNRLMPDQAELDSERVLQSIMDEIGGEETPEIKKNRSFLLYYLRVAVVAFVLIIPATLYFMMVPGAETQAPEQERELHFLTSDNSQKELTLSDGSKIRLNKNSELWISEGFSEGERTVTLEGEGYFEVTHNPENPFLVQTGNTFVQVLGTSFNVKAPGAAEDIQIAVLEGRVSVKSFVGEAEEQSMELEKNQFGFVNVANKRVTVENNGVENYLSWMNGRLEFDALPFRKVCIQLNRLYRVECVFDDDSIKERTLTANIQGESVEQVFEVISLAMNLDYEVEGSRITWLLAGSGDR